MTIREDMSWVQLSNLFISRNIGRLSTFQCFGSTSISRVSVVWGGSNGGVERVSDPPFCASHDVLLYPCTSHKLSHLDWTLLCLTSRVPDKSGVPWWDDQLSHSELKKFINSELQWPHRELLLIMIDDYYSLLSNFHDYHSKSIIINHY